MSDMELLRQQDLKATPLKQGSGFTAAIAAFPEDASPADFEWRISMAAMTSDSPFSHFVGVDRKMGVLSGAVALHIAQGARVRLLAAGCPALAFPGEQEVVGRPSGGSVIVLNVMVRRAHWVSKLDLVEPDRDFVLPAQACIHALAATGPAVVTHRGAQWELSACDTLVLRPPRPGAFSVSGAPVYRATCASKTQGAHASE